MSPAPWHGSPGPCKDSASEARALSFLSRAHLKVARADQPVSSESPSVSAGKRVSRSLRRARERVRPRFAPTVHPAPRIYLCLTNVPRPVARVSRPVQKQCKRSSRLIFCIVRGRCPSAADVRGEWIESRSRRGGSNEERACTRPRARLRAAARKRRGRADDRRSQGKRRAAVGQSGRRWGLGAGTIAPAASCQTEVQA